MKTVSGKEIGVYSLLTGDRIDCAGKRFDPVACTIRARTAGVHRMFDWKRVSSHTATVLYVNEYPMLVEMKPNGGTKYDCRIAPIHERNEMIISIYRYKALTPLHQAELEVSLVSDVNHTIRYDWRGLLEFLDKRFEDNPKDNYCSEHHTMRLEEYVPALSVFNKTVSPFDLQKFSVGKPDICKKVV